LPTLRTTGAKPSPRWGASKDWEPGGRPETNPANWTYIGNTKGFSQDRTVHDVPYGRPKKLWLKELVEGACAKMCARELPEASKKAVVGRSGARSPLKIAHLKSLRDAFLKCPTRATPRAAVTHSRQCSHSLLLGC
jgi:hypothetical protein